VLGQVGSVSQRDVEIKLNPDLAEKLDKNMFDN